MRGPPLLHTKGDDSDAGEQTCSGAAASKILGTPSSASRRLAENQIARLPLPDSSAQTTNPRLRQALFHCGPPMSRETVLCGAWPQAI